MLFLQKKKSLDESFAAVRNNRRGVQIATASAVPGPEKVMLRNQYGFTYQCEHKNHNKVKF